jgi:hypothetical protein
MQPNDKIGKSSWNLHESVKDAVTINVTNAVRSGQLKIEMKELEKLLTFIGASADEGYHRGIRAFSKTVDNAINEAKLDGEMPSLAKKK